METYLLDFLKGKNVERPTKSGLPREYLIQICQRETPWRNIERFLLIQCLARIHADIIAKVRARGIVPPGL